MDKVITPISGDVQRILWMAGCLLEPPRDGVM